MLVITNTESKNSIFLFFSYLLEHVNRSINVKRRTNMELKRLIQLWNFIFYIHDQIYYL
ncbi:hypothetical protein OENI_70004 [Oenococcus oeni]|nr:hypothetical protein OENI_70004 [Oenococcus oeni]SYW15527.1 hypothetical protein OENI_100004 [Oenococcus oeni]